MRACVSHDLGPQGGKEDFGKGRRRKRGIQEGKGDEEEEEKESIKRLFVMGALEL